MFPDNMLVCLGEYVISVLGNPPPLIMWYHNKQSVLSDGTIRIGEDGTLSIPSMEPDMLEVTGWWQRMSTVVMMLKWNSTLNQKTPGPIIINPRRMRERVTVVCL